MLTHPSLEASTNSDIRAWIPPEHKREVQRTRQHTHKHTPRAHTHTRTDLSQVVKVVLMMDPLVVGLQTVRLVGDVFDIGAEAVEKLAFKQLPGEEQ